MNKVLWNRAILTLLGGTTVLLLSVIAMTAANEKAAVKPDTMKQLQVSAQSITPTAIDYSKEMTSKMHNKIVHFPVALGTVALLFALLSLRWPAFYNSTRVLLFLAAAGAWAAVLTGKQQAREFFDGPLRPILHTHATLAKYTLYSLWACFILSLIPNSKKWLWVLLLVLACLIAATGFYGGILAAS